MSRVDVGSAGLLILLSLLIIRETAGFPPSLVPGAPGPAFFPRLLAGGVILLSLLLALQAMRRRATRGDVPREPVPAAEHAAPAGSPPPAGSPLLRSAATLGATLLFLLGVERVDFFLLLLPLLAVVMAVMGERRPKILLLVPLAFVGFVYGVFFRLFGVPFPTWLS